MAQGAIVEACVGPDAAGAIDAKAWEARGALLMADIGIGQVGADGGQRLSQAEAVRVYQYYLPLYEWMSAQIGGRAAEKGRAVHPRRPLPLRAGAPRTHMPMVALGAPGVDRHAANHTLAVR